MARGSKVGVLLLVLGAAVAAQSPQVRFPDPDIGVTTLNARARAQRASVDRFKVAYDFQFTDRVKESGITFVHRVVDDAAVAYKPVHYDHGNGIAVADVDGDGLPDIYFTNQIGGNQLWKNLGGGRFADITKDAGVALADRISVTASFADVDNDGDEDLFVTTVRGGNVLFQNDGHGRFSDVSKAAGVDYVGHSSGAVFFDFDNDGLVDLYVCNVGHYTADERGRGGAFVGLADGFDGHLHADRSETAILYKNLGGLRFRDVTKAMGLGDAGWSGDASVADLNDDGFADLYTLNMQGSNHYFQNQGGKMFVDRTPQVFPRTPWGAMGIKFFDYDNDGRPDLFVTDMHSDMHTNLNPDDVVAEDRKADTAAMHAKFFPTGKGGLIFGNALFANRGGKFEEVSDSAGVENYWPWGPSVDDLNADGWDDIFIASSMNFPYRYEPNAVLLNEAGRHFLRAEFLLGVEPRPSGETSKVWFTLDCKGNDANHIYCIGCARPGTREPACGRIDQSGHRQVIGTLGTRSAVVFDLDGDGDLDIVTQEFGSAPRVLISDLAEKRPVHWLEVALSGTKSNREGLGALVTVVLPDGRRLVKSMDGRSGYLAQSALPLYFGLGDAAEAERIEVEWPSGAHQTLAGPLLSGRRVVVTEP